MHMHLVLGSQLFDPKILAERFAKVPSIDKARVLIFMREDWELCTYERFHKQKIHLFLTAMRHYCEELRACGYRVIYEQLSPDTQAAATRESFESALGRAISENSVMSFSYFEIEDQFFETRIAKLLEKTSIKTDVFASPMFLTPRADFKRYLSKYARPFMKSFYEWQRKRLNILIDKDAKPVGGQWSFDAENRKALPLSINPPLLPNVAASSISTEVKRLCANVFAEHPGKLDEAWLPVERNAARSWLQNFLKHRLALFGPYEDAIPQHSDFVFHSVLTPSLNLGLLTPDEVVDAAIKFAAKHPQDVSLASLEGFVRQVIGWREFMRGIYQNFAERQEETNFFKHHRALSNIWYGEGQSGIAPLDQALAKVFRYGYAHHIERLMVFGSLMVLLEIEPRAAHRWFMEMFVDSSDWVMGPNVYGMALFSDGGIFATKPYICGSNYYRKMGPYKSSESWCDGVDGLYWSFVEKNYEFFSSNPRLSMITRSVAKIAPARKSKIYAEADRLRDLLTI